MKDVELPLRKAYTLALKNIGVPVYYQNLPNDISATSYVLITIPTSTDDSNKHNNGTETSVRIGIYTSAENVNTGQSAANIANAIYGAILPNPTATLTLDGLQMISTVLRSDTTEDFKQKNTIIYIDRFITFTHKINHK
jgi:hypothetical protein